LSTPVFTTSSKNCINKGWYRWTMQKINVTICYLFTFYLLFFNILFCSFFIGTALFCQPFFSKNIKLHRISHIKLPNHAVCACTLDLTSFMHKLNSDNFLLFLLKYLTPTHLPHLNPNCPCIPLILYCILVDTVTFCLTPEFFKVVIS